MHLLALLLTITPAFAGPAIEGNPQSLVRVVIFEDLQCSDCAKFRVMLDSTLLTRYGKQAAFEHRDFPLAQHTWSRRAAIAARYFDAQNPKLGVEFRRQALANLETIQAEELASWVAAFARQYGVDPVRAVEALHNPTLAAMVEKDFAEGVARGIAKTPTVFVDGEPFVEAFTVEAIAGAIETAIKLKQKH